MPVLNETQLVHYKDWILRLRPAATQPARLLLMIHGWTGDENSMWVFADSLPSNQWILAPRGLYATEPSGYSWRPRSDQDGAPPGMQLLQPAAEALMRLVDEYSMSEGIDGSQFDVMGFSQGAALGIAMAMMYPGRIDKLGVLAGFVPDGAEPWIARRPLQGKRIFVAHGTADPLVPVERARQSVQRLEAAGAEVHYCETQVGHKVSADCLRALRSYFQQN